MAAATALYSFLFFNKKVCMCVNFIDNDFDASCLCFEIHHINYMMISFRIFTFCSFDNVPMGWSPIS